VATSETVLPTGLDTSVVVRLLTKQPPAQAARALGLLNDLKAAGQTAFVSDFVVGEAYFALHAHYDVSKAEAIQALRQLIESGMVTPEPGGCSLVALKSMTTTPGKPGFADRLIHAQYRRGGNRVASFETAFRRLDGTIVLVA